MSSFPTAGALSAMRAGWPMKAPSPGLERCLLLAPGTALLSGTPTGDLDGTLQHTKGSLAGETVSVGRAVIVPGPQCTIVDAATVMLAALKAIDATVDIGVAELSCALVRYNEELLMPGRPPGPDQPRLPGVFPAWRVGLQLTLPLEFDTTAQRWVANVAQLKAWGAEYVSWQLPAYYTPAEPLDTPPDAMDYRGALDAQVPATGALAPLAASLRARLLVNACEAVLDLVHVLRAVRERRAADLRGFVLDLAAPLQAHQAKLLAAVSGGHAALRALWRVLAAIDAATLSATDRSRLAATQRLLAEDGLGLLRKSGSTTTWHAPQEVGPQVQPAEPPLAPGLRWSERIVKWERKGGKSVAKVDRWLNAIVLGRLVRASNPVAGNDVWGYTHSIAGTEAFNPVGYLKDQASRVPGLIGPLTLNAAAALESGPLDEPKLVARMQVAARIAESEGRLDAVSAGDPGIISLGMQQWAAHNDNELTVLLERFRVQAPDLYDLYIGMWGLQTARWHPPAGKGKEPADEAARRLLIDAANPFGPDPATLASEAQRIGYFPQHASFFVLAPQGQPEVLPPPPYKEPGPRRAYFLDDRRADAWCARMRLAELLSPELCRVQLHQAAWRFTRIETHEFSRGVSLASGVMQIARETFQFKPCVSAADSAVLAPPATLQHSFAELFPSEFAAAAVLDTHINVPGTLIAGVKDAIARTLGPSHVLSDVETSPGHTEKRYLLDEGWLQRLAVKLLGVRGIPNPNLARTRFLLKVVDLRAATDCASRDADLALASTPASFAGW